MGFALIMVRLVTEINVPMVLVLLFLHGHSYEPYTVFTFFLHFGGEM